MRSAAVALTVVLVLSLAAGALAQDAPGTLDGSVVVMDTEGGTVPLVYLTRPMDEIRAELSKHPVSTRLSLTGPMVVARDIAHARRIATLLREEGDEVHLVHSLDPGAAERLSEFRAALRR